MEYYSILWVEKTETKEGIKKAYRKLAMEYHPDRNKWDKHAEKKFKEINEAYSILSDDGKRKQYDMFWKAWTNWNPFWWGGFWGWVEVDLWDIFESFFGWGFSGWTKRKTEARWEDLEYNLEVDLKTSIYWGKETIKFNKKETCETCSWEGWSWKKTCSKCNWGWKVTKTSQSMFGMIQQTVICDECSGSWEIFENICNDCHWEKRTFIKKELEVDIPAWIDDGMIIKINEEWNHWVNSKAHWDLYVKFSVDLEEKWLKRDWVDLHYNLKIEIVEAVLWAKKEINIPIIWKRNIEIKAWSEHWSIIKISWDGVKYIDRDSKWDLFIELNIKIPKKLWKKERELYQEIAKERNIKTSSPWVFEKLFC